MHGTETHNSTSDEGSEGREALRTADLEVGATDQRIGCEVAPLLQNICDVGGTLPVVVGRCAGDRA